MPDPKRPLRPDTGSSRFRPIFVPQFLGAVLFLGVVAGTVRNAQPLTPLQPYACGSRTIVDGDTLKAGCGRWGRQETIRLANIDAPEMAACPAEAEAAADYLRALTARGFTATPLYVDRYGRTVATLTDPHGLNIAEAMVNSHSARPWPHDAQGRALTPRPEGCR